MIMVHGEVLACVGWFEMDGFCGSGCVLGLLCDREVDGYKMVEFYAQCQVSGNSPRYNMQEGGHRGLPRYRPFDVSGPKTRELR